MNECRGHASKVQAIVDAYKHANRSIQALCKKISESLLVSIDSKRIYESNEVRSAWSPANHQLFILSRDQILINTGTILSHGSISPTISNITVICNNLMKPIQQFMYSIDV